MSRAVLLMILPAFLACSTADVPPADTSTSAAPDVAGTWSVNVMPMDRDSVLVTYMFDATSDTEGWVIHLPGRDAMEIRVLSLDSDSIVVENGPYASVLEANVMVSTRSNMRVEDGRLVGTTIARYQRATADSVVYFRLDGTRQ